MLLQQVIAIAAIAFFVSRLAAQKKKGQVSKNEFYLWLVFWVLAAAAVIFIKAIDRLVAWLGFSGAGINFLIYIAVLALFYMVFRLRLDLAKMDRNLTEMVRQITLKK